MEISFTRSRLTNAIYCFLIISLVSVEIVQLYSMHYLQAQLKNDLLTTINSYLFIN